MTAETSRAIWTSVGVAVVVQVLALLIARSFGRDRVMIGWGMGALLRLLTVFVYGFAVVPALGKLVHLSLHCGAETGAWVTDEALSALGASSTVEWVGLENFSLITGEGVAELMRAPRLARLELRRCKWVNREEAVALQREVGLGYRGELVVPQ